MRRATIVVVRQVLAWVATGVMTGAMTGMVSAADNLAANPRRAEAASSRPVATIPYQPQDLAIYALSMVGVNYQFGGVSPERGLDCSGLVRFVFRNIAGANLPRTAREQAALGTRVEQADLQPGDLVFFNTLGAPFSHVGIYVGNQRFVHAPHRGAAVEVVPMTQAYWRDRFEGARRFIPSLRVE